MRKPKYILILFLILSFAVAAPAQAMNKLDFFEPIEDFMSKVEKVKKKIEDKYQQIMEQYNAKMRQALGAEGAALFNDVVLGQGKMIVKNAIRGELYSGNFTMSGVMDSIKNQLGNYKLDYATLNYLARDYAYALQKELLAKDRDMKVEMGKLMATRDILNKQAAENPSEEKNAQLEKLDIKIAKLQVQINKNMEKYALTSPVITAMDEKMGVLQVKIADMVKKTAHDALTKVLDQASAKLFNKFVKQDKDEMYQTNVGKFFLGKYEYVGPANVARVVKFRKQEYYKAYKNLFRAVIDTYTNIIETDEKSVDCTDASTMAEGLFGAMSMRICEDMQTAKTVMHFTDLLTAQMRFEATKEILSWNDKYKMYDYGRDLMVFNLDNYMVGKSQLIEEVKAAGDAKITGAVGKIESKLQ